MGDLTKSLEKLRKWRENNERNSREVVAIWESSLVRNINKLGKEKPLVLEQVCIAAFDCYQMGIAHHCIEELAMEFPKSLRVKKLEAMFLEADEKYDDALEIIESIIQYDDTNSAARKRRVAILKAQGRNVEAIKQLVEYLKVFMADTEAWQELSELYITEQDFNKAAFCIEELILHNPHNHLLHQRYADIKYTQGGSDNIEIARSYYCQAIKLNPKNIRALYGIYLTCTATLQKCPANKKKEITKLVDWVLEEIKNVYKQSDINSIEERLLALQI